MQYHMLYFVIPAAILFACLLMPVLRKCLPSRKAHAMPAKDKNRLISRLVGRWIIVSDGSAHNRYIAMRKKKTTVQYHYATCTAISLKPKGQKDDGEPCIRFVLSSKHSSETFTDVMRFREWETGAYQIHSNGSSIHFNTINHIGFSLSGSYLGLFQGSWKRDGEYRGRVIEDYVDVEAQHDYKFEDSPEKLENLIAKKKANSWVNDSEEVNEATKDCDEVPVFLNPPMSPRSPDRLLESTTTPLYTIEETPESVSEASDYRVFGVDYREVGNRRDTDWGSTQVQNNHYHSHELLQVYSEDFETDLESVQYITGYENASDVPSISSSPNGYFDVVPHEVDEIYSPHVRQHKKKVPKGLELKESSNPAYGSMNENDFSSPTPITARLPNSVFFDRHGGDEHHDTPERLRKDSEQYDQAGTPEVLDKGSEHYNRAGTIEMYEASVESSKRLSAVQVEYFARKRSHPRINPPPYVPTPNYKS